MSHFICSNCSTPHHIFGSSDRFHEVARKLGISVLGEIPLEASVTERSDRGWPIVMQGSVEGSGKDGKSREAFFDIAKGVQDNLSSGVLVSG